MRQDLTPPLLIGDPPPRDRSKWWAIALCFVFVLGFSGCGADEPEEKEPGTEEPGGADTTVSLVPQLVLAEGETKTLALTVNPGDAKVQWTSSDTGVATVDKDGKVSGVKAGSATVTVTAVNGGNTAKCAVTVKYVYGVPVKGAEDMDSIKAKFGVTATGAKGVTETFLELSAYIKSAAFTDDMKLMPVYRVIDVGDWIDLEGGLKVDAYPGENQNGGGDFKYDGASENTRLIVVGRNTFQSSSQPGGYQYGGTSAPHVVFHFKNIPVQRRMNQDNNANGGYPASEMREYLVPVTKAGSPSPVTGSGKFLAGLIAAGVPKDVLWEPARVMSTKSTPPTETIHDLLWLPTERELFKETGDDAYSVDAETDVNQAGLEYYTITDNNSDAFRIKTYNTSNAAYWTASTVQEGDVFCSIGDKGASVDSAYPSASLGVAPAFCVYGGQ